MVSIPFISEAQTNKKSDTKVKIDKRGNTKVKANGKKVKTEGIPPAWAPAHGYRENRSVDFPDYHMFYQPGRGYVYWNNGAWTTSSSVPAYLGSVDLGTARMQLLEDIDITTYPERNYEVYMRQFPAQPVEVTVPVPIIR
jgi:hypothetical protein